MQHIIKYKPKRRNFKQFWVGCSIKNAIVLLGRVSQADVAQLVEQLIRNQ